MIEIKIHLPFPVGKIENKVYVSVFFPVVPRVGEKIYLTQEQKRELLELIQKYDNTPGKEKWEDCINEFIYVEEVAYNAGNGSIHIELSEVY